MRQQNRLDVKVEVAVRGDGASALQATRAKLYHTKKLITLAFKMYGLIHCNVPGTVINAENKAVNELTWLQGAYNLVNRY